MTSSPLRFSLHSLLIPALVLLCPPGKGAGGITIRPDWNTTLRPLSTSLQLQVCSEPPMRRTSPIHKQIFQALKDLNADYNRFQPWHPYPRLSVAELEPPSEGKTFWDFSLLDPLLIDFMEAAGGRPVVVSFGPIPQWMFKTPKPVPYPADPNEISWTYSQGTELRDPSMKEVADYFARVAGWYTRGGFNDEYGKWHESGHHFHFAYWEVLNEIDIEHDMSPQLYTALYDNVVEAVRRVAPQMKFTGLALANPGLRPHYFDYFLDPKNHKPGIPVDMVSYHFYATPTHDETPEMMQYTFFDQADRIIDITRHIGNLRTRLSPRTGIHMNEVGSGLPDPMALETSPIPASYWNLSGAVFAYIYINVARIGVDMMAGAELIDYPGQFAATTMLDWETGKPNARYRVLKLLRDHFENGDSLIETPQPHTYVLAQAFLGRNGQRKVLVVNRQDRSREVSIAGAAGASVEIVDQNTASNPPQKLRMSGDRLMLDGYAVAVVLLRQ